MNLTAREVATASDVPFASLPAGLSSQMNGVDLSFDTFVCLVSL